MYVCIYIYIFIYSCKYTQKHIETKGFNMAVDNLRWHIYIHIYICMQKKVPMRLDHKVITH